MSAPKTPGQLDRTDLENIVGQLQEAMYLEPGEDDDTFVWNPEKEWTIEILDLIAGLLADHGLVPSEQVAVEFPR